MQSDLLRLLNLVQQGEEVVITSQGRAVAKLSAVPQSAPSPNRQAWLARLAELRKQLSTGKTGPTLEQILDEDRGD
jgi:antitoxin (DNA-binding transcriptional repressor) of toxin-antitoxin stability system